MALTSIPDFFCLSSHCSSRTCPVAAASWAAVAPFFVRVWQGKHPSFTRKSRQFSCPQRAAWWTGEAPWASVMVGLRHPDSCRALRASTSPSRAPWIALWSTILDLGRSEQKWQGSLGCTQLSLSALAPSLKWYLSLLTDVHGRDEGGV